MTARATIAAFAAGMAAFTCASAATAQTCNTGFVKERTEWTHQNAIEMGDLDAAKKLTFAQIVDLKLA